MMKMSIMRTMMTVIIIIIMVFIMNVIMVFIMKLIMTIIIIMKMKINVANISINDDDGYGDSDVDVIMKSYLTF